MANRVDVKYAARLLKLIKDAATLLQSQFQNDLVDTEKIVDFTRFVMSNCKMVLQAYNAMHREPRNPHDPRSQIAQHLEGCTCLPEICVCCFRRNNNPIANAEVTSPDPSSASPNSIAASPEPPPVPPNAVALFHPGNAGQHYVVANYPGGVQNPHGNHANVGVAQQPAAFPAFNLAVNHGGNRVGENVRGGYNQWRTHQHAPNVALQQQGYVQQAGDDAEMLGAANPDAGMQHLIQQVNYGNISGNASGLNRMGYRLKKKEQRNENLSKFCTDRHVTSMMVQKPEPKECPIVPEF